MMEFDEPGVVWYTPDEFLNHFHPGDDCALPAHACPGAWHKLETIRTDPRYDAIRASLLENGWVRPLPWCWAVNERKWGDARVRELIDGHTRASAAVELGMHIPLVELSTRYAIADDSGAWSAGDPIPSDTFDAMHEARQRTYPHPWATPAIPNLPAVR